MLAIPVGQVVVPFVIKADGKGLLDTLVDAVTAYESDIIKTEVRHVSAEGGVNGIQRSFYRLLPCPTTVP